jgi:hypothetical protein
MNELKNIIQELNPTYETVLPVSQKTVKFVPFKVKDSKNISIILKEQNKKLCLMAMVNILKTNSSGVDIDDLCLADAEYLYLKIRSKSVGEELNLKIGEESFKINIDNIQVKNTLTDVNIQIKEGVYAKIKTPKIMKILECDLNDELSLFKKYITSIIVKNEVYNLDTFISDEFKQLIDNLPYSFLKEIEKISKNQPELYAILPAKDGEREVSGTLNFFTLLQTS